MVTIQAIGVETVKPEWTFHSGKWTSVDQSRVRKFCEKHFCTGTLITLRMILTAAHCMLAENLDFSLIGHVYAHAGSRFRDLGTQRRRVTAKSCHPDFRIEDKGGWKTYAHDLCVLRVSLGLQWIAVQPNSSQLHTSMH